jgi:hypothetical protein
MEKTRVINGKPAQSYPIEWLNENKDKFINGAFVKDWDLAQKYQGNFINPIWNGSEYVEGATPEEIAEANKPIVPSTARSMNFRIVLIQNGITMQSIYDVISSLPSPNNELAYQMFEYATHYDRNNEMINTLAQIIGVSQEQLDNFFIQSENLVV